MTREIEIKLDLGSFANYLKLLRLLGERGKEEQQRNVFFDTDDRTLGTHGWALRVRSSGDRAFLTLKGISARHEGATVREESETEIPKSTADQLIDGVLDIVAFDAEVLRHVRSLAGKKKVSPFLTFHNLRQTLPYRLGDHEYLLEVDRTEFGDGCVEYELEVELESTDQTKAVEFALQKMFGSLEIPFVHQFESKFARALTHQHTS